MQRKQSKKAAIEKTGKKTLLESYYWIIICFLILIILFGAITFFTVLKPSKTLSENSAKPQNIRVNKIIVNAEIEPNHNVYYVLLKPANISGEFEIHVNLATENSFDFYIFGKKDDIKNSGAKPINTFLPMKNLNRTLPVKEGNVIVLVNSRDENIIVKGFVEYLER